MSPTSPSPGARVEFARRHPCRTVLAAQADGASALGIDRADDLFVDRAGQHHFDDLDGRLVGDAQSVGEARLNAELLQHRADLRATAMHDHGVHARLFEQHHVAGEIAASGLIAHRVAAVFDDDRGVVITQHMRQRLHQDFSLLLRAGAERVGHGLSGGRGAAVLAASAGNHNAEMRRLPYSRLVWRARMVWDVSLKRGRSLRIASSKAIIWAVSNSDPIGRTESLPPRSSAIVWAGMTVTTST